MAISKLKQIKQIVKDHPVTDPRGAMLAIEMTLALKNPTKKQKPVFRIDVFDHEDGIEVRLDGVDDVSPCHVRAVRLAIKDFIKSKCDEEAAVKSKCDEEAAVKHDDPERQKRLELTASALAGLFAKLNPPVIGPKVRDTDSNSTQGAN